MNNLFISGMARSGTTLLDKLLSNHKNIHVLSQPFPLVFVDIKKDFLKSIGIEKYFVLNDEYDQANYSKREFIHYLSKFNYSVSKFNKVFTSMNDYNGQYTKIEKINVIKNKDSFINFKEVYESSMEFFNFKDETIWRGIKEPLCEEFVPYFCNIGFKNILIIRDPRDVLSSANYPKGKKHLGNKKPTLFLLRSWRKSVNFAKYLLNDKNLHFLKYEDLVNTPYIELNKITNFLGVTNFDKNHFENGVFDQKGELWSANTSYNDSSSFISKQSVGAFEKVLSEEEIAYTEAICKEEMEWLNYDFKFKNLDKVATISSFQDFDIVENPNIPSDFSSLKENIDFEVERSKKK